MRGGEESVNSNTGSLRQTRGGSSWLCCPVATRDDGRKRLIEPTRELLVI